MTLVEKQINTNYRNKNIKAMSILSLMIHFQNLFIYKLIIFLLILPYQIIFKHPSEILESEYFWGKPDALVDWCEPNYAMSFYVAEFFNTVSSIPMIFWSIVGWYLSFKSGVKEFRYLLLFFSLALIGIGSISFHATLRFYGQLLDEISMIFSAYCSLFCLLEYKRKEVVSIKCIFILLCLMIFQIILYVFLEFYLIFLIEYFLLMSVQIIIIFKKIIKPNFKSPQFCLLLTSTILILFSQFLWILENFFCETVVMLKLHALWHILGGYGLFLFYLLLILIRGNYLKKNPIVKWSKKYSTHYVKYIETV